MVDAAIGAKVLIPVVGFVWKKADKQLTGDEDKRLRLALAEAIANPEPDPVLKRPLTWAERKVGRTPKEAEPILKALNDKLGAPGFLAEKDLEGPEGGVGESWRTQLAHLLANTAKSMKADSAVDLAKLDRRLVGDGPDKYDPDEWAHEVVARLEWEMTKDPGLRHLLARLEWKEGQAAHIVVANSADDMRKALWEIAATLGALAALLTYTADAWL